MSRVAIERFRGIAPIRGQYLPKGMSFVAENVDLRSGKIIPVKMPSLIDSSLIAGNSLIKFGDVWKRGNNKFYNNFQLGDVDILLHLEGSTLRKTIQETTADVGQAAPTISGVVDNGSGSLPNGVYQYIMTTVRRIGDFSVAIDDLVDTEADFGPTPGGRNVSENQVDYTPPFPISGRCQLSLDTSPPLLDIGFTQDVDVLTSMISSGAWGSSLAQVKETASSELATTSSPSQTLGVDFNSLYNEIGFDIYKSISILVRHQAPGGYGDAKIELKISGVWYSSPTQPAPSVVQWKYYTFTTNPATGLPWAAEEVLGIEEVRFSVINNIQNYLYGYDVQIEYPPYNTSGTIRLSFDLGPYAANGNNPTLEANHNAVGDQAISYQVWGSNTGAFAGEEASLGVVVSGGEVTIYRYYEVLVTFTRGSADTFDTPWLDALGFSAPGSSGALEDESGPSEISSAITVTTSDGLIRITRGDVNEPNVVFWNIYRLDTNATTAYQFVAQVAIADTYYDDEAANADLSGAPSTFFLSAQRNTIIFAAPLSLDGLMPGQHIGMFFGWKGSRVYWSEPGLHDAWPTIYFFNFPAKVKYLIPFNGIVAVLTEEGPFRIEGSHPELLSYSDALGEEPCVGRMAIATNKGIFYMSDSGIVRFNMIDTEVVTGSFFSEEYFKAINADSITLAENDQIVYLFHDQGALVYDYRVPISPEYRTLKFTDDVDAELFALAAWKDEETGDLYISDREGIKLLNGSDEDMTWIWQTGRVSDAEDALTMFSGVRVVGKGQVAVNLYLDDVLKTTKELDFSSERGMRATLPAKSVGMALKIELTGTGRVDKLGIG